MRFTLLVISIAGLLLVTACSGSQSDGLAETRDAASKQATATVAVRQVEVTPRATVPVPDTPTPIPTPTRVVPTPTVRPTSTPVLSAPSDPTPTVTPTLEPSPTPRPPNIYTDEVDGWSIEYPLAAEITVLPESELTEFGYGYRDPNGAQISVFYYTGAIQTWPTLEDCAEEFRYPQPLLHSIHQLVTKYEIGDVLNIELNGVATRLQRFEVKPLLPGGVPADQTSAFVACGITGSDVFYLVAQSWPAVGEAVIESYLRTFTPVYEPPSPINDPDLLPIASSAGASFGSRISSFGSRYSREIRLQKGGLATILSYTGPAPESITLIDVNTNEPVQELTAPESGSEAVFSIPETADYRFLVTAPLESHWRLDVYWAN